MRQADQVVFPERAQETTLEEMDFNLAGLGVHSILSIILRRKLTGRYQQQRRNQRQQQAYALTWKPRNACVNLVAIKKSGPSQSSMESAQGGRQETEAVIFQFFQSLLKVRSGQSANSRQMPHQC